MLDDWQRLIDTYPQVAFNVKSFVAGKMNSPANGFKVLVQAEPYVGMPENWDLNLIREYQTIITWNSKFYQQYKHVLNLKLVNGCLGCNPPERLSELVPYENKIHGVCILNNLYGTGRVGDIYWLRNEFIQNVSGSLKRHVWCTRKWGGDCYQGAVLAPYHHSHEKHLKKIAEYKFCACFESSYHSFWSAGFITERILNCFRAGTVPVYIGCYDIENYVPKELFIDFREFWPSINQPRQYSAVTKLLETFPQERYIKMIKNAYDWVKDCRIGSIVDLERAIKNEA